MSTQGWQPYRLDELGSVARGKSRHRPRNDPSLYGGPYPFFQTGDIKAANLYLSHADQTYNEKGLAQSRIWPRGTLCITIAANISETAFLAVEGCFPDSVVGFIADPRKADARFVKYSLDTMKVQMQSISRGTTQDNLSVEKLLSFRFPTPALDVQHRIANVLSAYDDLIEVNTRRIAILEEMARRAFDERFVQFRFPGHEGTSRVPSSLGNIPFGWQVTRLQEITSKIGSGATPRGGKNSYQEAGITLIRSMNVYDYRFEFSDLAFIDEQQAAELDNVAVEKEDILLNITGASVCRCALVPTYILPARVNQHVSIVRADPAVVSPFYLLDAINSEKHKAQLFALAQGGATREALTKETICKFEVVLPPRNLVQAYDNIARPIHSQREVLYHQAQNLRAARDLLLPKLISGEIDLSLAEAKLEAAQ